MGNLLRRIERLGYRPARHAYQRLRHPEEIRWRSDARSFFGQFIAPGALVFDVGANVGALTDVFLRLGARVVAVEPNPELAAAIERRYAMDRLTVLPAAAGAQRGTASMRIGKYHGHSTLSDSWAAANPDRWTETIDVEVTTMDALAAAHGAPDFVKLDVEGYELQALLGMSRPAAALSLEYQCADLQPTHACVRRLEELERYVYNWTGPEGLHLLHPVWTDAETAMERLEQIAGSAPGSYGDLYARRAAPAA
jgi:FkbM family methyltransferase